MTVTIDTPRLHLRPHRAGDAWDVHELTADPQMRTYLSHQASEEDSYRRFLANVGCWALFGFGTFAVIERETKRYVGNCGIFRMKRDFDEPGGFRGEPEAGWIIRADRWGRGYATEAMTAAIDWYERTFGPQASVCMIVPGNDQSEKIAARLGYDPIGRTTHRGDTVGLFRRLPLGVWRIIHQHSYTTDYKDSDLHVTRTLYAAPAGGGLAVALASNYPNGDYGYIAVQGAHVRPIAPVTVFSSADDLPHWAALYTLAIREALAETGG